MYPSRTMSELKSNTSWIKCWNLTSENAVNPPASAAIFSHEEKRWPLNQIIPRWKTGRLLNNHTQRLPTNLVTHPELYAQLIRKTHVTTIDLSDAFFQIPLYEDSQPLTCFYSQAHGKRYCFTRCPQGLKNSPLALKLFMDKR